MRHHDREVYASTYEEDNAVAIQEALLRTKINKIIEANININTKKNNEIIK